MKTKKLFFKASLLIICSMISVILVTAKPVSQQQAKSKAISFLKQSSNKFATDNLTLAYSAQPIQSHPSSAEDRNTGKKQVSSSVTPYYVFNIDGAKGFIIVSGDDRAGDVLGYSDNQEEFSEATMHSNIRSFLKVYEEEMQWIVDNVSDSDTSVSSRKSPTERVEILCKSRWGQDSPYNLYTPTVSGRKTPTGCVATAMAQVMYHHRWPQAAISGISGYTTRSGTELSDLPAITFDWANMRNTYNSNSSTASKNAVARLMQYCGYAVNMNYAPGGSGAYTYWLPYIMESDFLYSSGAKTVDRLDYSIDEWETLMYNELRANRPIVYTGYTSAMEGHAFVCDGYDGNGLFHINWGWNGSLDGFFRLSLLNAGGTGTGGSTTSYQFSVLQMAVIGLGANHPGDLNVKENTLMHHRPYLQNGASFTRSDKNQDFSDISLYMDLEYNTMDISEYTYYGVTFDYAIGLYQNGELLSVLSPSSDRFYPNGDGEYAPSIAFGSGTSSAVYQLRPVCRKQGETYWKPMIGSDRNYIEAAISGNLLRLTIFPRCNFQVSQAGYDGRKFFTIDLHNPSEEFNGFIYLHSLEGELLGFEQVSIPAASDDHVDIYVEDASKVQNDDIVTLSVYDDQRDYFYISAINENAELQKQINITNLAVSPTPIVYGNKIGVDVDIDNIGSGDYRHLIEASIKSEDGSISSKVSTLNVNIAGGTDQTISLNIPVKSNYFNKNLYVEIAHYEDRDLVVDRSESFRIERGANYWTADGTMKGIPFSANLTVPEEALAIELRQGRYTSVTPNSNPNTIYLLSQQLPEGLAGLNLVNATGGAGLLNFVVGYDYYIPETITASKGITVSLPMTEENANRWQTIALPFAPESITTDDGSQTLSVAKTTEEDADIYLGLPQRFVDNETINISLSTSFIANMPCFILVNERNNDKVITFKSATNIELTPDNVPIFSRTDFSLVGSRGGLAPEGAYVYDGTLNFVRHEEAYPINGFAAYLIAKKANASDNISLRFPIDTTTSIIDITTEPKTASQVYSINGQLIGNQLPNRSGIYIVNGRKVIVK